MKKILIITCMVLGFASLSFAQKKPKTEQPQEQTQKSKTKAPVTKTGTAVTKPTTTPVKPVVATTVHTKADGTPDKRFKENKEVKPAGPLTKSGKPDMCYKANNPKAG